MNFDELRLAIEVRGHMGLCKSVQQWDDCTCNCQQGPILSALATLEREHAERERRLREDVLGPLTLVHDGTDAELIHDTLAEILDSSQ